MLLLPAFAAAGYAQTRRHESGPILTKVAQIRALTEEQAGRKYPIHLQGVITYRAPEYVVTFFQDESSGIFVFIPEPDSEITAGARVELDGNTTPGHFAPSIDHARIHVVGRANLPVAAPKTVGELLTGSEDSQWVAVKGIVHTVTIEDRLPPDMCRGPPQLVLGIASGSNKFKARIKDFRRDVDYRYLVDSSVTVRGACGTLFNDRRQLAGVQLFVPGLDQVTVERSGPADPYTLAQVPINILMQFSPARASGHRVRIQGVVTLSQPGYGIFVQDASGGVFVESEEKKRHTQSQSVVSSSLNTPKRVLKREARGWGKW